jgi:hypothetical protein
MRTSIRRLVPALGALVFAGAMIPSALAQCRMPTKLAKPASWHLQMNGAQLIQTGYEEGPSIVGMWHVIFTAKTSDKKTFLTQSSTMAWQYGIPTKRKS